MGISQPIRPGDALFVGSRYAIQQGKRILLDLDQARLFCRALWRGHCGRRGAGEAVWKARTAHLDHFSDRMYYKAYGIIFM